MRWQKDRLIKRINELGRILADPEVATDPLKQRRYSKEFKELNADLARIERYEILTREYQETEELLKDPELKEEAASELKRIRSELERLEQELKGGITSKERRGCIIEIRPAAGGEEAGLFACDLFRMYTKFLERKGIRYEILSSHRTGIGGFKEVILSAGSNSYDLLQHESGVHRVQRIPITEGGGRIHTSTATVAVLPEVGEIELKIDPKELKIETFRASGHGGQHVNVTDSAVRITHLPTGIVASCQDERSQHKNRTKAMKILRARLSAHLQALEEKRIKDLRRHQVGSGDRSEKIRTYNFPQNRVTDHRIGLTVYQLDRILDGYIDRFIEALKDYESKS
ncbi:MAG TPA: peptide chain release factor 1 [bacterium (Candidatus Stahlbacteria)]|nr:peptide chain release factor 1 [Candidatus Stahlbacteria bacterium]